MEHFHYVENKLHCEDASLAELAACFGTPAYVYSRSAIEENFNHLEGRLAGYSKPGLLLRQGQFQPQNPEPAAGGRRRL